MTNEHDTNNESEYEVGKWYGWNGGECPVHPQTVVQVRLYDQNADTCDMVQPAADWNWSHTSLSEIVAFRIVTPYVEPKPKRECWIVFGGDSIVAACKTENDAKNLVGRPYNWSVVRMVEANEQ